MVLFWEKVLGAYLEEYEHAKLRGANIYAEIVGFGMSADAHHITSPPDGGQGAALSMQNAVDDAEIKSSDIGYINAHGTSTPAGDIAETEAIKAVFKDDVGDISCKFYKIYDRPSSWGSRSNRSYFFHIELER